MKKIIILISLLTSFVANAKLTIFSSQDAARIAIEQEVLAKILKKSNTQQFVSVKVDVLETNDFVATVETKSSSTEEVCITKVQIKDKRKTVILPGGGAISANKLAVSKVQKSICE